MLWAEFDMALSGRKPARFLDSSGWSEATGAAYYSRNHFWMAMTILKESGMLVKDKQTHRGDLPISNAQHDNEE